MEPEVLEDILDGRKKPTNLQFSLLRNITKNFSEEQEIGKGGFATVYKGVLPNGNVAVKRIMNSHTIDDALFYREVDSLLAVNHRNIVQFLGYCASTDLTAMPQEGSKANIYAELRERLLCFEYIGNRSLQKHITDELRGLEWNARYEIIKGICNGLDYLHNEKRIYHMDLKPANILLDSNMVPKITDFGQSRYDEKSQTISINRFGTRGYCPPEYALLGKMSPKSDIYSLGIIIIELVTGDKEIPNNSKSNVLRRWRHRWKKTGKETPLAYQQVTKCIDIGLLCQEIDPTKRPPIGKIIFDINEMDSTDGQTRNAYESFSLISPYPEDGMLGVEPLELHFPFELNKQISCSLKLTNQTNGKIAFKIQKMRPLLYCTKPDEDTVLPGASCSVDIILQAQHKVPWDRQGEFIVWSTKVTNDLAPQGITTDIFSNESGVIDEVNLDVVFGAEESTKENDNLTTEDISTDIMSKVPCVAGDVNLDVVCDANVLLRTQTLKPCNLAGATDELGKRLQNSNAIPISLPLEFDVSTKLTSTYGVVHKDKAARHMLRANKFIEQSTEVNDGLAVEDITTEMSNKGADNVLDKEASLPTSSSKINRRTYKIEALKHRVELNPDLVPKSCKKVTDAIHEFYATGIMNLSTEDLFRCAYNLVQHNYSEELYSAVETVISSEVEGLGRALDGAAPDGTLFLQELLAKWQTHREAACFMRNMLMYMDRTFVPTNHKTPVYELALYLWRDSVVRSGNVLPRLIAEVRREREGDDAAADLAGVAEMLKELGDEVYHQVMGPPAVAE